MSYLIVFLSGLLTALPFLCSKLFLLSWISMTPLFVIAAKKKSAYRHGLVFGMGFYLPLYYWFIKLYPMEFMGLTAAESIPVIATCWIGLSLLQALEIALVPFLYRKLLIPYASWAAPFSAAACYCAFEWLQTLGWTGVPWGRLAVSQYQSLPMLQSASILGSYFIGFLIVLTNGFFALFILKEAPDFSHHTKPASFLHRNRQHKTPHNSINAASPCHAPQKIQYAPEASDEKDLSVSVEKERVLLPDLCKKECTASPKHNCFRSISSDRCTDNGKKNAAGIWKRFLPVIAALSVVLLNFCFGVLRLSVYHPENEAEPIKTALIQGNLASGDKWADDSAAHSVELYAELTRNACEAEDVKLVLWPETVLTFPVRYNAYYDNFLRQLSAETGAVLLIGAFDTEFNPDTNQTNIYNAMIAYLPDGTRSDSVYYKRHLVPFGEYLPMADLIQTVLPQLSDMNLMDDDLTPGTEATLISTEWGNVGALICFDSIYETLTMSSVRNGAEMIALITNDSWYLDSAAVYQHNGHAVIRAVESGRYVARAANTGISSVIAPTGEIMNLLEPLREGYITGDVCFLNENTIYTRIGNVIVWLSFLYIAGIIAWKTGTGILTKISEKRSQNHFK